MFAFDLIVQRLAASSLLHTDHMYVAACSVAEGQHERADRTLQLRLRDLLLLTKALIVPLSKPRLHGEPT